MDDDAGVRHFIAAVLAGAGFEVVQAADGFAGVEAFRGRAADIRLVLIDLTMPGKSGLEVAADVRHLRPDVPVLLTSGYSDDVVSSQLAGGRIDGFLHKPFGPAAVLEAVQAALRAVG